MIRNDATERQVRAADPQRSTWLTANAGSGKTRVLTDRVARLLLQGIPPQNILCLTYTKAAASEMQNRLFRRLGSWAMRSDDDLRAELAELGAAHTLDDQELSNARTLFASAIETPGGLKIQTIHSFCASILRRFPMESGVSPQFQEMEDRAAVLLRTEVVDAMSQGNHRPLVERLMQHFSGAEFDGLLGEIARRRGFFTAKLDGTALRNTLGLTETSTIDSLLAEVFSKDHVEILTDLIAILRTGGKTDNKAADVLAGINFASPTLADIATVEGVLLFGKGAKNPFGPKIDTFPTKALRTANPDLTDALNTLMEVVADNRHIRLALQTYDRTLALHAFAHHFVAAYDARKSERGMLDFDDLIEKARTLLTDRDVAEWVLYRLDGGIDHILVDEAQDTSPAQWAVVRHLTQELTAGEGARSDKKRTIFVVGDKKQSIYSFQGADPAEFDAMRDHYKTALNLPDQRLETADLSHSFRSSQAILSIVDRIFAETPYREAVGWSDHHIAFKSDLPGRVDLWPVIEKDDDEEKPNDWHDPVDRMRDSHHDVQMAQRVASQIKHMIANERLPTPDGRRPITEGDFLILVQRRSALFSEIIRACKSAGLRVAGADRFRVGAVLAVKDIAALLNFLALPEDDLSLAANLRSPLFGWSEQDLFSLAHYRAPGATMWEALRNSDRTTTLKIIQDLLDKADFMRPFDLIDRILLRHDGRRNLLARLGPEAEDGIDALLAQALNYEQMGAPSLTGFLSWMETDDLEIKRQIDSQSDQIRVMSVHGSKGLEAPIVILPDCANRRNLVREEVLISDDTALWKGVTDDDPAPMRTLRDEKQDAQLRERLRLLYVAMTRAEQWLIVGAAGDLGSDGNSWHDIIANGIMGEANPAMSADLSIQRVSFGDWDSGTDIAPATLETPAITPLTFPPLVPISRPQTLSPSDLGGAKALAGDQGLDQEDALAQGRVLHLLLEHLPNVPQPQRTAAAKRIISAAPDSLRQDVSDALIGDALRVLSSPGLAHIFAPDARAEVEITANLPELDNQRIHGTIDRLIIRDDHILAVDFKSNRLVPDTPDQTPDGVLRQMAAYAAALAQIYPEKQIETAILWTHTATLMPLPTQNVASALSDVTRT